MRLKSSRDPFVHPLSSETFLGVHFIHEDVWPNKDPETPAPTPIPASAKQTALPQSVQSTNHNMPNYTLLTNHAGEQPIIRRLPSELAAIERYRKNNIPKPASTAIKGDDITFSAGPNPQNQCGLGFTLTTPTTIGPNGHIPVKARRNIIPFWSTLSSLNRQL